MNFKKATDALLESITLEDLANAMGASLQSVRQARAAEGTTAYRSPPPGWEAAVLALVERSIGRQQRLAEKLKKKN